MDGLGTGGGGGEEVTNVFFPSAKTGVKHKGINKHANTLVPDCIQTAHPTYVRIFFIFDNNQLYARNICDVKISWFHENGKF